MGHLNSFSASGGGNLNKNFPKIQMPGGLPVGGMFKLRFDWYINAWHSEYYHGNRLHGKRAVHRNTGTMFDHVLKTEGKI